MAPATRQAVEGANRKLRPGASADRLYRPVRDTRGWAPAPAAKWLCERLKVQPAELGYIEREQSAGVVEEHAKPPDPAAPKPTPTPIPLPQPFDLLDPDKGLRPLSAKAKQSEAKPSAP